MDFKISYRFTENIPNNALLLFGALSSPLTLALQEGAAPPPNIFPILADLLSPWLLVIPPASSAPPAFGAHDHVAVPFSSSPAQVEEARAFCDILFSLSPGPLCSGRGTNSNGCLLVVTPSADTLMAYYLACLSLAPAYCLNVYHHSLAPADWTALHISPPLMQVLRAVPMLVLFSHWCSVLFSHWYSMLFLHWCSVLFPCSVFLSVCFFFFLFQL